MWLPHRNQLSVDSFGFFCKPRQKGCAVHDFTGRLSQRLSLLSRPAQMSHTAVWRQFDCANSNNVHVHAFGTMVD
jgi:hypothetical protein